jgi:hypothetical protein
VAQQRARISALVEGTDARREAEDRLAQYILLRERELTEQLKPEWLRRLEAWEDTTRLMRESGDRFMEGFIDGGEQMWLEFARTGKLNAKDLFSFVAEEAARSTYRETVAPLFAEGGKALANLLGFKPSGGGGGGEAAAQEVAQAAAQKALTTAITDTTTETLAQTVATATTASSLAELAFAARNAAYALNQVQAGGAGAGSGGGLFDFIGSLFGGSGFGTSGTGNLVGPSTVGMSLDKGGFTGNGGEGEVAGVVHGKEYVFSAPAVRRLGVGALEKLHAAARRGQTMPGYRDGGYVEAGYALPPKRGAGERLGERAVGGGAAPVVQMNVRVINQNPRAQVSAQQGEDGALEVLVTELDRRFGANIAAGRGEVWHATKRRAGLNDGAVLVT